MATLCPVWFVPFTRQHARLADIITALENAGLTLVARRPHDACAGPGILFLDTDSNLPEVAETLAELPSEVKPNVLAVSVGRLPGPSTWALLRSGVADVFSWFDVDHPVDIVTSRLRYWLDLDATVAELQTRLVGSSPRWCEALRQVVDMAHSSCQVLITGESGTGKELVAQEIHRLDTRPAKRDCVVVDCTNLIPGLSGSELEAAGLGGRGQHQGPGPAGRHALSRVGSGRYVHPDSGLHLPAVSVPEAAG